MSELNANGVAVVMEATHTCMTCRSVYKPGSIRVTSAVRGEYCANSATRAEVMSLLHKLSELATA